MIRKKETRFINIRNERDGIITDSTDGQRIIRNIMKNFMKINLDEIGKFFERLYLQTLSQKEIKTLNSPISITEIELNF